MNISALNLRSFSIKSSQENLKIICQKFHPIQIQNPKNSIENLKIEGVLGLKEIQNLTSNCMSVTSLTINIENFIETDVLKDISIGMPNLKYLSVTSFFAEISEETKFEKVEKLKITNFFYKAKLEMWDQIALACPNIRELRLCDKFLTFSPLKFDKILRKLKKLEVIEFKCDNMMMMDEDDRLTFFNSFLDKALNVKAVGFFVKCKYDDDFCEGVDFLKEVGAFRVVEMEV